MLIKFQEDPRRRRQLHVSVHGTQAEALEVVLRILRPVHDIAGTEVNITKLSVPYKGELLHHNADLRLQVRIPDTKVDHLWDVHHLGDAPLGHRCSDRRVCSALEADKEVTEAVSTRQVPHCDVAELDSVRGDPQLGPTELHEISALQSLRTTSPICEETAPIVATYAAATEASPPHEVQHAGMDPVVASEQYQEEAPKLPHDDKHDDGHYPAAQLFCHCQGLHRE
mmetsp:Transcript_117868/g.263489  ORF Transcript_117868/g.263489 Transcript_117868/m.263489 type:complete len:226 (-) Transcript_117868:571-1248(-)